MRIIRIVSEGVVSEIYDTDEESLEKATERITRMMKSDKVVTILGKNSSIVVRPSKVSAVTILDDDGMKFRTMADGIDSIQNQEQKIETVDEITDIKS